MTYSENDCCWEEFVVRKGREFRKIRIRLCGCSRYHKCLRIFRFVSPTLLLTSFALPGLLAYVVLTRHSFSLLAIVTTAVVVPVLVFSLLLMFSGLERELFGKCYDLEPVREFMHSVSIIEAIVKRKGRC